MSEITLSTSVAELVAAGHVKSLEHLKALLSKPKTSGSVDQEVLDIAQQITDKFDGVSDTFRWRTGNVVAVLFGLVSGSGCQVVETERKLRHGQVSKALKLLSEQGVAIKHSGSNAAHTYYTKNPAFVKAVEETEEAIVEEEVEQEQEAVKPKVRVRSKSK